MRGKFLPHHFLDGCNKQRHVFVCNFLFSLFVGERIPNLIDNSYRLNSYFWQPQGEQELNALIRVAQLYTRWIGYELADDVSPSARSISK